MNVAKVLLTVTRYVSTMMADMNVNVRLVSMKIQFLEIV